MPDELLEIADRLEVMRCEIAIDQPQPNMRQRAAIAGALYEIVEQLRMRCRCCGCIPCASWCGADERS